MSEFGPRDYWQQQFLAALRPHGLTGSPARAWFRARWEAQQGDEEAAVEWARDAAAAEFLAEVGA